MEFDKALVKKYDRPGPRYTSYPTAPQFSTAFGADDYIQQTLVSNEGQPKPLSLYVHVPFCQSLCYYCACHKIVTQKTERAAQYLTYLTREITLQSQYFAPSRTLTQLHFGGGTPTYFTDTQLSEVMDAINQHFNVEQSDTREFSIEVDPRTVDNVRIRNLKQLGFNRLSFGIQDFDPAVQQAVNRVQSFSQAQGLVTSARDEGFKSISVDLIYGLPLQTIYSFDQTLDQIIALKPDRIAAYSYAHLPEQVRAQRMINPSDMPPPERKLELLELTIKRLTESGYVYIGMDHFALPDDELTKALKHGTLQRNFQGYSTHAQCDLIGIGVSAIGKIGHSYSQNAKELKSYYAQLDQNQLPIAKGYQLNADDRLRAHIISKLMCHGALHFDVIDAEHGISFVNYFKEEVKALKPLQSDGLVELTDNTLQIRPQGHLLLRNIAMVFDRYLQMTLNRQFSRTV